MQLLHCSRLFFFFNDPATTEIYTLSLHDALPISGPCPVPLPAAGGGTVHRDRPDLRRRRSRAPEHHLPADRRAGSDRKSTRLNSSHQIISYAVFCLKKKTYLCISRHFSKSCACQD